MQCKLFAGTNPDNIIIGLDRHWSTKSIDTYLREKPLCTYPPERSLIKMVFVYVSQSLPPPFLDALLSCFLKLADFSSGASEELWDILDICSLILYSAQLVSDPSQATDNITPLGLRADVLDGPS